mmetsp:Transcript_12882/g.27957  ORF Transcript_12882/g.27957 Transcript_12882/m.27957 type:complete len:98 (+) Transcript_12882:406-699(+)
MKQRKDRQCQRRQQEEVDDETGPEALETEEEGGPGEVEEVVEGPGLDGRLLGDGCGGGGGGRDAMEGVAHQAVEGGPDGSEDGVGRYPGREGDAFVP